MEGFGREKALQMGWCGGRAFQKAEGSRQRPVGVGQQPESQPRLAGGGRGGWLVRNRGGATNQGHSHATSSR